MRKAHLFVLLAVSFVKASVLAADTTAPRLESVALSTTNIDVSVSNQIIRVTIALSDDLSGLTSASLVFVSPSHNQQASIIFGPDNLALGDNLGGVYTNVIVLPLYSETGLWVIQSVELRDATTNVRPMDYGDLLRLGFPLEFTVTGIADTSPPEFQSFQFSPDSVDANSSNRWVNFTIHVTDDLSGISGSPFEDPVFAYVSASFRSPSGRQHFSVTFGSFNRMSGNKLDGIYTNSLLLPEFCETGVWALFGFDARDAAGNTTNSFSSSQPVPPGFPKFLTVTGTSDTNAPVLTNLALSRTNVNTTFESQSILVTAHTTDDLSGLDIFGPFGHHVFVTFSSPSGNQSLSSAIVWVSEASGNGLEVVLTNSLVIPRYSETGIWLLDYVTLYDSASNYRQLTLAEVRQLGFPFSFKVEELPKLTLHAFGNSVLLSWPVTSEGFSLQSVALLSNSWTNVSVPPIQFGDDFLVVLPLGDSQRFFRLIK